MKSFLIVGSIAIVVVVGVYLYFFKKNEAGFTAAQRVNQNAAQAV